LVVGDGRLQVAVKMPEHKRQAILDSHRKQNSNAIINNKHARDEDRRNTHVSNKKARREYEASPGSDPDSGAKSSFYSMAESKAAYDHLSDYHKKKGWDSSGWWAKKG